MSPVFYCDEYFLDDLVVLPSQTVLTFFLFFKSRGMVSLRINFDHIQPGVTLPVNPNFKLKKLKYFTREENAAKLENKGVFGCILHITKPKPTNNSNQANGKKQRTSYTPVKSYHRWILCGDLMNPPHTFALITHSHSQSFRFFHYVMDQSLIGLPFYLIEPKLSTGRLNDYLHIVEVHDTRLIPLKPIAFPGHFPVTLPRDGNQTYWFLLKNQEVKLATMKYHYNTCTGYQCDRQKEGECVCVKPALGDKMVYEFDFMIRVDKDLFNLPIHVITLASFAAMSVFFVNLGDYLAVTNPTREHFFLNRRRSQFRRMIKFINARGGFELLGWCKKGLLQIDGESERVANDQAKLHLSSVRPQDPGILDNPEFKALQIRADFDIADADLTNLDYEDDVSSDSSGSEGSDKSGRSDGDKKPKARPPTMILATNIAKEESNGDPNDTPVGSVASVVSPGRSKVARAKKTVNSSSEDDSSSEDTVKESDDEKEVSSGEAQYFGNFPPELYVDEVDLDKKKKAKRKK